MQYEWIFTLIGTAGLLVIVLMIVVYFVIAGLLLGAALGFVGGKNRDLGSTFITAVLMALVSPLPCINCILGLYFIKTRHNTSWFNAAIAWILTFIIALVIVILILMFAFSTVWLAILSGLPFP